MIIKPDVKTLLKKNKLSISFWRDLESTGSDKDRGQMFEFVVAQYLKATLPGDTYWPDQEVVPPKIAKKYKFDHLLQGGTTLGFDIINIHKGKATAYEVKWVEGDKAVNFVKVANKLVPIQSTNIDKLVFCSNARDFSSNVSKFTKDLGFIGQSDWFSQDVFLTVKEYVATGKKRIYFPLKPRDEFFVECLDDNDTKYRKHVGIDFTKPVKILQHWPAATGKGSFPRLAYDQTFEQFAPENPINLVVNPTLVVLKGNLLKHIEHDLALNNDVDHVVFSGDVTKGSKDTSELQMLRAKAKVFDNKKEFVKYMKTTNKAVWIHTTLHSYTVLAGLVKELDKKFYFAHIDEVHHAIMPDWSKWSDSLNDNVCEIQIRFMSSANRRNIKKSTTYVPWSMDDPNFCDYEIKGLTEKKAVELGYKRQTVIVDYGYDKHSYPKEFVEMIDKGSQPFVKVKGHIVPIAWFNCVDALVRFRLEYPGVQHTKLTLNTIEECVGFGKFMEDILPDVLNYLPHDKEMYNRIRKAKIQVADTKTNNTIKILKDVSLVPENYNDSFIIHCRLLGEGWDPENGWIDSNMFISPTWSEIRIYQDVNRGSRYGDGSKKYNYVLLVHLQDNGFDDSCNFTNMFSQVRRVAEVLELGEEDVKEFVKFKLVRNIPKGSGITPKGSDIPHSPWDLDPDWMADKFGSYWKAGKYYAFGDSVNNVAYEYIEDFKKYGLALEPTIIGQVGLKGMFNNVEFFDQFKGSGKKYNDIIKGEDFRLSSDAIVKLTNFDEEKEKLKIDYEKFVFDKLVEKYSQPKVPTPDVKKDIAKKFINHFAIEEFSIKDLQDMEDRVAPDTDKNHWQYQSWEEQEKNRTVPKVIDKFKKDSFYRDIISRYNPKQEITEKPKKKGIFGRIFG